jgi:hypothetical protein
MKRVASFCSSIFTVRDLGELHDKESATNAGPKKSKHVVLDVLAGGRKGVFLP